MNRITQLKESTSLLMPNGSKKIEPIRYAVVGLGNIAQEAVLPGFLNARVNSKLTAFVSDDPKKLKQLAKSYHVSDCYSYDDYDTCLQSGRIDAVYIALPNNMPREFVERSARAGVHVLCEKPLALTQAECEEMIQLCEWNHVRLMAAYRLHFERANLEAISIVHSGRLGEPRYFNSTFSQQVKEGIRTSKSMGGGSLFDMGVYCINAARYLFKSDPYLVSAFASMDFDERFKEVDEMTSAIMRFPGKKLASFTCSLGATDTASYEVICTKGTLRVTQAYEYTEAIKMEITEDEKVTRKSFPVRDQFGPEIIYFSNCIQKNHNPEPSGQEGLIDVQIIEAINQSARTGEAVALQTGHKLHRPDLRQEIHRPSRKPLKEMHNKPINK
jgi:predicted dehydrogenase